jgi:hypothetical protein
MLSYSLDKQKGLVIVTGAGVVTGQELLALQDRARKDPDYDPRLPVLMDYRELDLQTVNTEDLRQLSARSAVHPSTRRALLVSGELAFGLARMFQAFSAVGGHSENIRVFRNRGEALAWLLPKPGAG